MKTAQRLQRSRDEGHDFVLAPKCAARTQTQHRVRLRFDGLGIHALVDYLDSGLVNLRISRALPKGWRQADIALGKCEQRCGILQMKRYIAISTDLRKLWIEADIASFGSVKKFAIQHDPRAGKYGPQRQRFAPAGMGHNHIGLTLDDTSDVSTYRTCSARWHSRSKRRAN